MLFRVIYWYKKVVTIKKFESIKSDAFDTPKAPDIPNTTTTMRGHEYKIVSQNEQIMRQLKAEKKKIG